jgi:N-acetylglucosamine transport system substrate-binding protein
MTNKKLTRRTFVRGSAIAGGAALMTACAPAAQQAAQNAAATAAPAVEAAATQVSEVAATVAPTVEAAATAVAETAATTAPAAEGAAMEMPFPMDDAAKNPLNIGTDPIDGVFFSGGFGHAYIEYAGKLVEANHPGVKVSVKPVQKVAEELRPRVIEGNPPDVIDNSGAGAFNTVDLVNDGQLQDLAELFAAPSWDTPGVKFADTLFPGSQTPGVNFDGKQLGVNVAYTVSAIWYSKPWLEQSGITIPPTWAEYLTVLEGIKNEGKMAPWTYQGKYPYYMWGIVLNQLMWKSAGNEQIIAIDNLEPNAWKTPEVLRAVQDMYALWDKGLILEGTAGLTHTESQALWLQGKAAFIPCGTWLENEMKEQTPPGFNMTAMGVPGYADGKGSNDGINAGGGEPFVVFSKAKNVKGGMEFLRAQVSRASAKWFAENVSSLMPVKEVTGLQATEGVKSAIGLVEKAGTNIIEFNLPGWYSEFSKEIDTKTGELMTGIIKPEEFVDAMQKKADDIAANPDIPKFKRSA